MDPDLEAVVIEPGTVLTTSDPEPPEYTVVVTGNGSLWVHAPDHSLGGETVDTWSEFITEHGPVTVVVTCSPELYRSDWTPTP